MEIWRQNLLTIEFTREASESLTIADASILTYNITARTDILLLSSTLVRTRGTDVEAVDAANYTLDLAAGTLALDASVIAVDDSFELSYRYIAYLRLWTGWGELTVAGKVYQGRRPGAGGQRSRNLFRRSRQEASDHTVSHSPRSAGPVLQDSGPLPVTVGWIYSQDRGASWQEASIKFRGRLSGPSMTEGTLTVELETQRGDVDRGRPLRWSHEDQQRRHPDDLGLEHMRALSQQGVESSWPP